MIRKRMIYLIAQAGKRNRVNKGMSFMEYLITAEHGIDLFELSDSDIEENLLMLATMNH